ncbi:hypothetical protein GH884_21240 [Bacillus thuringiensis]|nr:hypothetical protein [Bacillus thuringiensis]
MRYDDIKELLDEVEESLLVIKNKYEEVTLSKDVQEIAKPKILATMVQLRSCLDYCMKDISEIVLKQNGGKQYFPYTDTKRRFKEKIKSDYPKLRNENPNVYAILESVQDFNNTEYSWLSLLCRKANKNKHDSLIKQSRQDNFTIDIPGFIKIENSTNVIVENCAVGFGNDLIPLNFTIDENGQSSDLKLLDKRLSAERIDWVTFNIEGTDKDVLEFLTKCTREIRCMVEKLYKELTNQITNH